MTVQSKKLDEPLLNEEKLKDEIRNSSLQSTEYHQEIDHLNKLLDESLIWKTKHQKLKWYHRFAIESKSNKNGILGTSYDARISELKQQISILEHEKCEVEEKLSSYMEDLIKTKENGHYNDTVRTTYQDFVIWVWALIILRKLYVLFQQILPIWTQSAFQSNICEIYVHRIKKTQSTLIC